MEKFTERQIATINTIEDRIKGHKDFLMRKKRIRYTFKQIFDDKISELRARVYKKAIPCDNWEKREAYYRAVDEYEYIDADFIPINVGDEWGGNDVTCFFRKEIEIPQELEGEKVELQFYVGGDSLVSVNGHPVQGLDPFRNAFTLTQKAVAGEKFIVEVESFCFYATPVEGVNKRKFECSILSVVDKEISDIYWDLKVGLNLLEIPDISHELEEYVEGVFHEIFPLIDTDTDDNELFMLKLRQADEIIKEKIYNCDKFRGDGMIDLIGHSHLDIIYMWDYKEFVRKTGRTHATMLALLDEFPEFKFSQSQAVTYMEIKNNFPELYERIKKYVAEGRWEVIGAMWVEPDCNLPSGESFIRQLLEGKKFFQEEFGITPETCWLPDVFGNSYGMPQILKKSGIRYFVTHKPAVWNDTNKVNHNTFRWMGSDGSEVLAVISPSHFVGTCEPNHVMLNWSSLSDKRKINESLYCYGWGDGGGGVSPDMIENAKRMKHIVGMPDTRIINAEEALKNIEKLVECKDLPVLQSEIYLEAHRAVPTIRTEIKKYNRYCERLLHDAELYGVMAEQYGYKYNAEKLQEFSRMILTNQFHDILPGTHVASAYKDIIKSYKKAVDMGETLKEEALSVLAKNVKYNTSKGKAIAVFNPLSYAVTTIVDLAYGECLITDEDGNIMPIQKVLNLDGSASFKFEALDIPALGYKVFYLIDGKTSSMSVATYSSNVFENKYFRITFNKNGDISSIIDKRHDRELIKTVGNKLRVFYDNASNHDAWDIVPEHRECEIDISGAEITEFENGPVLASVLIKKNFLNSTLNQKIVLYNNIDRIDFVTRVDWHENQKTLRVDFDFDVVTDKFTANLAYANIERPINAYNTYDEAKFEICAQDFVDLSEDGYGVSILSEIKNAYGVKDTNISLSLLRAPIYPDKDCDRGINEFTYSIYSHSDTWKRGKTVQSFGASANTFTAMPLNECGDMPESFAKCNRDNVIIEVLKKAEANDGIIVRVLEKYGRRTKTSITFNKVVSNAFECDLMENIIADAIFEKNTVSFEVKPNEIKTFKIVF